MSVFPELIDRIEVLRGDGTVQFGQKAIGGTVNIIPKRPRQNPGTFWGAEMGSWHTDREWVASNMVRGSRGGRVLSPAGSSRRGSGSIRVTAWMRNSFPDRAHGLSTMCRAASTGRSLQISLSRFPSCCRIAGTAMPRTCSDLNGKEGTPVTWQYSITVLECASRRCGTGRPSCGTL